MNCLKWLVEESSAYVELAVRDGQTSLLHHAASEGMEQCLTYLLAFMAKRKITTGKVLLLDLFKCLSAFSTILRV